MLLVEPTALMSPTYDLACLIVARSGNYREGSRLGMFDAAHGRNTEAIRGATSVEGPFITSQSSMNHKREDAAYPSHHCYQRQP